MTAYLPTYQSKEVVHGAKAVCMYITKEQKNSQNWGLGHCQD